MDSIPINTGELQKFTVRVIECNDTNTGRGVEPIRCAGDVPRTLKSHQCCYQLRPLKVVVHLCKMLIVLLKLLLLFRPVLRWVVSISQPI
jgi:hypothetical protein